MAVVPVPSSTNDQLEGIDSGSESEIDVITDTEDGEYDYDAGFRKRLAKLAKTIILSVDDASIEEKKFMHMWNKHILKYNLISEMQFRDACVKFIQLKGNRVVEKNLYGHFVLHLLNMYDFRLLEARDVAFMMQMIRVPYHVGQIVETALKKG